MIWCLIGFLLVAKYYPREAVRLYMEDRDRFIRFLILLGMHSFWYTKFLLYP